MWQNDKRHGKGTYTQFTGEVYTATWVEGYPNGWGTFEDSLGYTTTVIWYNNEMI